MKRDRIYDGHILSLLKLDDKWEVVEHAEAVAVLAIKGSTILGVRQYRPAIAQITWEVPAGLIEAGESPEEAARRELAEETQLTGKLDLITQLYSSPGFTTEKIHLFLATELSPVAGIPDDDEVLEVTWEDPATLWEAIKHGELASSGPAVLALHYALTR